MKPNEMKRTIPLVLGLLLAPLATLHAAEPPKPAAQPNIVFIYADDWGWGDLGCHGHAFLKTPNIDRLAKEGTDFQQFNVLNPVCSPSRAAALTGRYPSRFGINTVFGTDKNGTPEMPDWLDAKAPTTPRFLKAAGYRTGHFGKWHLGVGTPTMADYGIDETTVYHGPGPTFSADGKQASNLAAAFIERNKDRPFYLNVWLHESHTMHAPSKESLEQWQHLADEQKRIYAAVITDGDNHVGKILDTLDRNGLTSNTLVVFSSDNGPESTSDKKGTPGSYDTYYSIGETGGLRGRKRSLFEGGIRVPFIVRWPGHTPANAKNDTTVFTAVDLLPTFCAAAGITPPADAKGDGENLLPALQGKAVSRTRPIFWLHKGGNGEPDWWPRLAVRNGKWKLLTTYDGARSELHDLTADRAEEAAKDQTKQQPEIAARLTKLVLDWYATLPTEPDPTCLGKPQNPSPKTAPKSGSPAKDRNLPFNHWDTNKDEFLSLEEYKTGLKGQSDLEARHKRFDKDGDGKVSRKEFVTP